MVGKQKPHTSLVQIGLVSYTFVYIVIAITAVNSVLCVIIISLTIVRWTNCRWLIGAFRFRNDTARLLRFNWFNRSYDTATILPVFTHFAIMKRINHFVAHEVKFKIATDSVALSDPQLNVIRMSLNARIEKCENIMKNAFIFVISLIIQLKAQTIKWRTKPRKKKTTHKLWHDVRHFICYK